MQLILSTQLYRRKCWLLLGLLWLLASPWLALGQSTSPFVVQATPLTATIPGAPGGNAVLKAAAIYPAFNPTSTFNPATTFGPGVQVVQALPDGKVLVGGNFSGTANTTRNFLARLNPDGSFDQSFGTAGKGFNASVQTLAVLASGKILVGGSFTSYTSASGVTTTRSFIARLFEDGTLDTSFDANGAGLSPPVYSLAIQANGKIVATNGSSVIRLTENGTLDSNFALDGSGLNGSAYALAIQPDGKILVGGIFSHYNGNYFPNIVRLNTTGSHDKSFQAVIPNLNSTVFSLAIQPDGKVLIGGRFTTLNTSSHPYIGRLNTDGSLDATFAPPSGSAGLNEAVISMAIQPDGRVLVGGYFTKYGTTDCRYIARLKAEDGTLDTGFAPTGIGLTGSSSSVHVNSLSLQANGKVLAGGIFDTYNTTSRPYIARLNANGLLDDTDTPVPGVTYAWSNGSTGPTLNVVASGTYTATATSQGLSATSNAVVVTGAPAASYAVRVTPAGPMRICPGTPQVLTAQAVSTTTAPLPTPLNYQWLQVVGTTTTVVSTNSTYTVPTGTAGTARYYVAKATSGTTVAASPTLLVAVMPPPTVSFASGTSATGAPGTALRLVGTNLDAVTQVLFGTQVATFTHTSPTELSATVPSIGYNGPVTVQTPCTSVTTSTSYRILPSITSFSPQAGPVGTLITVTGTGFSTPLVVTFGTSSGGTVNVSPTTSSSTQFTVVVPATAATGNFSVTAATGSASSATAFVVVNGPSTTVNFPATTLPLASYTNVVVASGTTLNLTQNLSISGQLIVRSDATLNTGLFQVTGGGGLVLEAGATLTTAHAQGFSASAATGAIVLTGTRRYATDASYGYTGTTAQVTGDGLPGQVRNLRCANTTSLTLTNPVAVAQVLTMASTGNFILNNQPLTLLSGPGGTALVHNQGAGVVVGAATVQRYIDPTVNPTTGFRYYGAPVRGATAAVFPASVFAYDETRATSSFRRDTTAAINAGFVPTALLPSTGLEPGRGYRAAVPATTTVSFVGTLNTDTLSLPLTRSLPAGYSGWHLVSNPYPSPLDWSLVDPADRPDLDAAIYIYESTGPGTGYFRSYVNGAGTGSPLIAAGQAFFVRVSGSTPSGTGRLRFRNSQRISTFDNATQPVFNRTQLKIPIPELIIELERNGSRCPCGRTNATQTPVPAKLNSITVYTPPGATAGFDRLLDADAGNLFSPAQQTLGMRSNGADTLAVQALPSFSATTITEVPLTLSATTPDEFKFTVSASLLPTLLNGAQAYLRDASVVPNNYTPLTDGTVVTFKLQAAELLARVRPTRFYLRFGPLIPTAATAGAALQSATVYPNPTHERIGVQLPGVPGATQVQATLLTTLGQVVLRQEAALPTMGTTLSLPVPGLASGIYILRLRAGDTTTTHRVVLE